MAEQYVRQSVEDFIIKALQSLGGSASKKTIKEEIVADDSNDISYMGVKFDCEKGVKMSGDHGIAEYVTPPESNANYDWILHMLSHLKPEETYRKICK